MIELKKIATLAAAFACTLLPAAAQADTLAALASRGEVVIGVKADYPPWGMRDQTGALIGMEIDLANDLAARIGVPARVIAVQTANRMEVLRQHQADIIIATMGDNESRRRVIGLVEPHYYASGVTLMMRADTPFASWDALAGQPVCAKQGSYFNAQVARRFDLDLMIFKENREAKLALRNGRCVGFLFDDSAIAADLLLPEWQDFGVPLPALDAVGWSIGLRHASLDGDLGALVSEAVADWHRTGYLVDLEAKWGIPPTEFLTDMHALWSATDASGQPLCALNADLSLPEACRFTSSVVAVEIEPREKGPVEQWFNANGLSLTIVFDPYDRGQFLRGVGFTIALAVSCILISVGIGLLGAWLVRVPFAPVRWAANGIIEFFRYTPPLVQLYFFYFGVGALLPALGGFAWAAITLGLYAGASNAAIFGAGLATVPRDTRDSALALGYTPLKAQLFIIMPLALRNCLPALNANLVNIVKASGLAAAIAVPELLYVTNQIWPEHGNTAEMMNVLLIVFFVLVSVLVYGMHRLEKRLKIPGGAA